MFFVSRLQNNRAKLVEKLCKIKIYSLSVICRKGWLTDCRELYNVCLRNKCSSTRTTSVQLLFVARLHMYEEKMLNRKMRAKFYVWIKDGASNVNVKDSLVIWLCTVKHMYETKKTEIPLHIFPEPFPPSPPLLIVGLHEPVAALTLQRGGCP